MGCSVTNPRCDNIKQAENMITESPQPQPLVNEIVASPDSESLCATEQTDSSVRFRRKLSSSRHEKPEFGWDAIKAALLFSLLITGVNIVQRLYLGREGEVNAGEDTVSIIDMLVLNIARGAGMLSLSIVALIFLCYESEKISIFVNGATKFVATWYIIGIGLIEVFSHADSFFSAKWTNIATNIVLLIVAAIEVIIDLDIAACFRKAKYHYADHARYLDISARASMLLFALNALLIVVTLILNALGKHLSKSVEISLLVILILADLTVMAVTRLYIYRMEQSHYDENSPN